MEKDKDIKKQEAEIVRQQEEQRQRAQVDSIIRNYQDVMLMTGGDLDTLAVNIKNMLIRKLSDMINIVEKDSWVSIHPHDAFPNIDIRMLAFECPANIECPFLLAILRKIGMQRSDYVNYRKRMGMMIGMEHKRKMGKRK